jgi:predicted  nucleic acid-binding Zn-ribbon protein
MDKQQLREQLENLHTELQGVESLNDDERKLLQDLTRDVQEVLARDDEHTEHYSGLGERMKETVAQLEASHPKITLLMRQIIDQLAFMGI